MTSTRAPLRARITAASAPLKRVLTGHQDGAGREQAERRHHPLGAVAAPDRHPVAGLDPGRDQRGAELPGRLGQLRVGKVVSPSRTATRSANCSAAPSSMAGMEGQAARPAPAAHRRPDRAGAGL